VTLRNIAAIFTDWMDCVALMIGDSVGYVRAFRRVRLMEEEVDTFKIDLAPGVKNDSLAAEYLCIADGAFVGPVPKHIASALRGSRVDLILRSDRVLLRPLDLPKRAGEFLEGIVRSQIDRLTPWSAADAAFGWSRPTEIAKDRITLTVVATARALVSPYIQALMALGVKSVVVSTAPQVTLPDADSIEIMEQSGTGALDVGKVRRALAAALLLAAVSMGIAVAADQFVASGLETQKNDILGRVAERRAVFGRDGLSAPSAQLALERRKRESPSSAIVLEALSQILPDHTYATELRVEGDKLQVIGITHDAPSLIRLIEQSPHFTSATFFAPTTRSPGDPGERFHIEARIKPGFALR
jgi:general secretion pathway protein L